jgi:PAS domain S-box-containing protein
VSPLWGVKVIFTVKGWALIAVTAGALINAYVVDKNTKKELSEVEKQLISTQNFLSELTQNDVFLQEELVASNTELNRRMLQLATLLEIAKELMVTRSPKGILERISVTVNRLIPSEGVVIRILSKDESYLNIESYVGLPEEYVERGKSIPLDSSPFAKVIKENKPLAGVGDYGADAFCSEATGAEGVTFHLSVPIVVHGKAAGVLSVYTPNLYDRTSDDIQLLTILAAFASSALESAKLYEELGLAYHELSSLKDYNESILESITLGLAVVNRDLTINTWNPGMEDITGIRRPDAVGRSCFQVPAFHEDAGFRDLLRETLEEGVTCELNNLRYVTPDGRERIVSCRACPLMSLGEASRCEESFSFASGLRQPLGAVIIVQDVTATVTLEEQLRWAERMRVVGEFSAGIAHEINNPIGIISACAEHLARKLEREKEVPDDYLKSLKVIEEEATRCSSIIKNLTVFARRQEFNLKAIDVGYVIQGVLELVRPQAKQSGVTIKFDDMRGEESGLLVLADEAQIRQVFLNLALNAIQSMADGGLLRVDIVPEPQNGTHENVKICFTDTGCGIAEEDLKKVFTPFFTTRSSGIGLGLAVSHGIIQSHSGTLTVHSKEGQGSSFAVSLPWYYATTHVTP